MFQFSSAAQSCPLLCDPIDCSMPGLPVYHQLPEFTRTHAHWIGDAIKPSHPLLSPSLPAFNLSQHQGLVWWVSYSHQVAKVLEFQLQHQSCQWIFRISFRMDWLDLLAVQGTLKSLLQHHSSKTLVLWCSVFFIVQLSYPYMTIGKTTALTRWTLVGKVMSLLFNMLSRLVITFLPRSKSLLISWLKSPSAVILEPPKIKSVTVSTVSPSICHEVMDPDVMILRMFRERESELWEWGHYELSHCSVGSCQVSTWGWESWVYGDINSFICIIALTETFKTREYVPFPTSLRYIAKHSVYSRPQDKHCTTFGRWVYMTIINLKHFNLKTKNT